MNLKNSKTQPHYVGFMISKTWVKFYKQNSRPHTAWASWLIQALLATPSASLSQAVFSQLSSHLFHWAFGPFHPPLAAQTWLPQDRPWSPCFPPLPMPLVTSPTLAEEHSSLHMPRTPEFISSPKLNRVSRAYISLQTGLHPIDIGHAWWTWLQRKLLGKPLWAYDGGAQELSVSRDTPRGGHRAFKHPHPDVEGSHERTRINHHLEQSSLFVIWK